MKKIRVGNIELLENTFSTKRLEIVCWYPNEYYLTNENKKKLEDDGYVMDENGNFVNNKKHYTIDKSCTTNKECCYTIATIQFDSPEDYDIVSLNRRCFDLEEHDRKDLLSVLDLLDTAIAEGRINGSEYSHY